MTGKRIIVIRINSSGTDPYHTFTQ